MPTSKLARLNKLFEGGRRIAQVEPNKSHITDIDINPKVFTINQVMPNSGPPEIPGVARDPRKTTPPRPPTGRDLNLLTSSDEDDYVAAFSNQPTIKKLPVKFPSSGKPKRGGYQRRTLGREHLTTSTNELSDQDVFGHPLTGHFCPLALVVKFPYKYMVDTNDRVSRHFFAQNKFYHREWEIFYIDPPVSMAAKPILLLPLAQVKHLIQQINLVFKTDLDCPPDPFTVSFYDDGTPQPKRLGISHSRDDVAEMEASIPTVPDDHDEELEYLSHDNVAGLSSLGSPASVTSSGGDLTDVLRGPLEGSFAEFKAKMERIVASTKKDKQAAKQKKMDERLLRQQDWVKQLKRAQCYLGLRPKPTVLPAPDTASPWSEQQKQHEEDLKTCGIVLKPLDIGQPAPYPFESDPVIVCVDVEAYERDNRKITEVGISTLDTRDLACIAPGTGGENWIGRIRSRHFRIRGRGHLENKDFCPGNADNFQFGISEWISLDEAAKAVDKCFEYPFSAEFKYQERNRIDITDVPVASSGVDAQRGATERNVIFLGHDIRNEFEYLKRLGSKVFSPGHVTNLIAEMDVSPHETGRRDAHARVIEALDTGVLYRVLVGDTQNQSLGKMMLGLGRTAFHLHNAGNDARYTLEVLIGLLIKARLLEDEPALEDRTNSVNQNSMNVGTTTTAWDNKVEQSFEEKADAVEQEVKDECKGWEKTFHTMTITDNSGKQVEVEDPWLMAQESDQEPYQSPSREGDGNRQRTEETNGTKTIMYRDPAATGGHYQLIETVDALEGGTAEQGGIGEDGDGTKRW